MSEAKVETAANAIVAEAVALSLPALWGVEEIKTDQNGIRGDLLSIDARIHRNAVMCMMHAEKHGDTSLMRRLLIDIVDAKSGYRRQGIIAWMKMFSPMRLNGDVINLSGMDGEVRQAFRCEKAWLTPFTSLKEADERVAFKPVYKDNLTANIARAVKQYKDAIANTRIVPGKKPVPIDPKKPFYDGIHLDKMETGFDKIEAIVGEFLSFGDETKAVREAHEKQRAAELALAEQAKS